MIAQPQPPPWDLVVVKNTVYNDGETRCCVPDCTTILSRYNSGPDCWVHYHERMARMFHERQARRAEAEAA